MNVRTQKSKEGRASRTGLLALPIVLLFLQPLQAAFQIRHTSAKSAAMGNAFLAAAGEASALFTNPAGIGALKTSEISFLYAKPFAGLPEVDLTTGHAAFALPTRYGHIGAGYAVFQADSLMAEQTLALSYAGTMKSVQVGVTAKQLSHNYNVHGDPMAHDDPVFAGGTSKSAMAFDIGAVAPLGKNLKAGLAVRNWNEPNVGLLTEDKVAREIQTGVMLNMAGLGLKASGDILVRNGVRGEIKNAPMPFLGLEKTFKNAFALRLGANTEEYSGGFGLKWGVMAFDYALVINKNLMEDNAGSHKLGMRYRFVPGRK